MTKTKNATPLARDTVSLLRSLPGGPAPRAGQALAPNPNPLSEAVVGKAQGNPVDGK